MKKISDGRGMLKLRNKEGFTLIELLIVMAIIGLLASVAVPVFYQYKARAYDAHAKAELHNIYVACKAFWVDNGPASSCTTAGITNATYDYAQSPEIKVTLSGSESTLSATATSVNTGKTFRMNEKGMVS